MKETGIIRRVDDLGRVVIPKEIRRSLKIKEGDPLEIFVDNNAVVFKRYSPLSVIDNAGAAVAAMNQAHMSFAIYDKCEMLVSSTPAKFPYSVPPGWDCHFYVFADVETGADVFPVISSGELYGYVAVITATQDEKVFAKAVASMLSASLS